MIEISNGHDYTAPIENFVLYSPVRLDGFVTISKSIKKLIVKSSQSLVLNGEVIESVDAVYDLEKVKDENKVALINSISKSSFFRHGCLEYLVKK